VKKKKMAQKVGRPWPPRPLRLRRPCYRSSFAAAVHNASRTAKLACLRLGYTRPCHGARDRAQAAPWPREVRGYYRSTRRIYDATLS